ncbi:MAG: PQQ-binding-like beta-propeller repeat protein, partial [Verrucomicrobiales bacterium]|nr:PQQ-binding-like beta-propeller repeat protein [Verrucomicrobiales bacterium]
IDEEYTFERLTQKDDAVHEQLEAQEKALNGEDGAIMQLVSIESGESNQRLDLESPPVWDGMAVARGKLFVAGEDGKVRCFASVAE